MNLVTDPWIPVIDHRGTRSLVGLRDVFARATELAGIEGDTPHVRVALIRLLLAVFHRATGGPRTVEEWATWWEDPAQVAAVCDYLDRASDRFELFDDDRPFWQCPTLPEDRAVPVAKLVPSLASGNNPVWFDHTSVERPARLTWAEAARWLVALQMFDPGGLHTGYPRGRASSQHAPLAGVTVVLPEGTDLARTLLLAAVRYDPASERPFAATARSPSDDLPVWERKPPGPEPAVRSPSGYVDWLTWSSLRVRLFLAGDTVEEVAITPGDRLPDGIESSSFETFVPLIRRSKQVAFHQLRFEPDRAAWRNSQAILAKSGEDALHRRARVVDELDGLIAAGHLPDEWTIPLCVTGLAVRQSKVLGWAEDRLGVPARVLDDVALGQVLSRAVETAERVARATAWAARLAVAGEERAGNASGGLTQSIRSRLFALLASASETFLLHLPRAPVDAAVDWSTTLEKAVWEVWETTLPPIGDAEDLRRRVVSEARLWGSVRKELGTFTEEVRLLKGGEQ